jgi:hypothetical protein
MQRFFFKLNVSSPESRLACESSVVRIGEELRGTTEVYHMIDG